MIAVKNASGDLPKLGVVDDYYVNLIGNHFQQDKTKFLIFIIIMDLIFIAFTN